MVNQSLPLYNKENTLSILGSASYGRHRNIYVISERNNHQEASGTLGHEWDIGLEENSNGECRKTFTRHDSENFQNVENRSFPCRCPLVSCRECLWNTEPVHRWRNVWGKWSRKLLYTMVYLWRGVIHSKKRDRRHTLSSCIKSVSFIKLHQVCENQTWCNLIFADLLQNCCIELVGNLLQTCYRQAGASDANASWYQSNDCEATILQQPCCPQRKIYCLKWSTREKNYENFIDTKFSRQTQFSFFSGEKQHR